MGLKRHLTTAEIVDQVVFAQRLVTSEVGPITNVVFMVSARSREIGSLQKFFQVV